MNKAIRFVRQSAYFCWWVGCLVLVPALVLGMVGAYAHYAGSAIDWAIAPINGGTIRAAVQFGLSLSAVLLPFCLPGVYAIARGVR